MKLNTIKDLTKIKDAKPNDIVYGYGKLKYCKTNLIKDSKFGVSSLSNNAPGLYRKIEVY